MDDTDLANGMLALVPEDGSAVGNVTLRSEWTPWAKKAGHKAGSRDEYWRIRQVLLDDGRLILGKGKGGSVRRAIVSVAALETKRVVEGTPPPSNREISLYSPIKQTIEHTWAVAELGLPENSFQLCVSAFQGKADTGFADIVGFICRQSTLNERRADIEALVRMWFECVDHVMADLEKNSAHSLTYLRQNAATQYTFEEYAAALSQEYLPRSLAALDDGLLRPSSPYDIERITREIIDYLIANDLVTDRPPPPDHLLPNR